MPNRTCRAPGCDGQVRTLGLCNAHYHRWLRSGRPDDLSVIASQRRDGESSYRWKSRDELTYRTMHRRLRVKLGSARTYDCVECGEAAHGWAYQHDDPNELMSEDGPFSDRLESYAPMCNACHASLDAGAYAPRRERLGLVSLAEVGRELDVTSSTARARLDRAGVQPVNRDGRKRLRYRREDVAAFLADPKSRGHFWSAPDIAVALDESLSPSEAASMVGRSVSAVSTLRWRMRMLNHERGA